jgi:hypothetical protein
LPILLGREERFKSARHYFFGHSNSGINYGEHGVSPRPQTVNVFGAAQIDAPRPERERASL